MLKIDADLCTEKSARDFVKLCEREFEDSLDSTIARITADPELRIITLAGPTCSGKTTTAAKLTDYIDRHGYRARVMSVDDFYKDHPRDEENPDYESADAIDLDYFAECTEKLLKGEKVFLPTYDMKRSCRAALTEYVPHKNDIYIFEGIQAVYPEITCHLKHLGYTGVFISVADDICANGETFKKEDIRLFRRLVRDDKFRSVGVDATLDMWANVRANEEKNIYPHIKNSDYTINSFLPYELYLIGKYLIPLFEKNDTGRYTEEKRKIVSKLSRITSEHIKEEMIPRRSMFREFIG